METDELLQYLRFREVQKILDELLMCIRDRHYRHAADKRAYGHCVR